jgi:hypothetical protein
MFPLPNATAIRETLTVTDGAASWTTTVKAFETNRSRPMYADANMGHPSTLVGKRSLIFQSCRLRLTVDGLRESDECNHAAFI